MKKIISLIYLLGILFFQVEAQQYQNIFGNEITKWILAGKNITPESVSIDTISIIGTEGEYRILEYRGQWDEQQIIGKMRVNGSNSKLYFKEQGTDTEVLIMDLDLSVGDTFTIQTEYNPHEEIHVENVYIHDNKKHIQFTETIGTSSPPGEIKREFIEGVGPNWGFAAGSNYLFICKSEDGMQTYSYENEYIRNCGLVTTSVNLTKENEIIIYPNPMMEQVFITIPEMNLGNLSLTIYNSSGEIMLTQSIFQTQTILDISHFPAQTVYYFTFQLPHYVINRKILKQ